MKLGISAFAWTGRITPAHLKLLPLLKQMGFSAFEIPMFDPGDLPVKEIRAAFEANEMDCTVCAILPNRINPLNNDPLRRREAIQHLTRCIETAAAMGCKLLGGPLFAPIGYLPPHRRTAQEWEWGIEYFQAAADDLARNNIEIAIEPVNRAETFFLRTTTEAKRLCEEIGNPRIGVTIDTFHANIEEQDLASAVHKLGPRLKHVHASENDRGVLGRGHVPFADLVSALNAIDYHGYLMIEGFGYTPSEPEAPGYLLAPADLTPECFAAESYAYLRRLLTGPAL